MIFNTRRRIFLSQIILTGTFGIFLFFFYQKELFIWAFTFYALLRWYVLHRITSPLQRVIDAMLPLKERELPDPITIEQPVLEGEFGKIGIILNSLIERIRKQVERAQEQKRESEGILHSLEEGVVAVDTEGIITFANGAACKMLQIAPEAILGHSFLFFAAHFESLAQNCHELIQQVLQTSEMAEGNWGGNDKKKAFRLHLRAIPRIYHNGAVLVIQDRTSDYRMVEMGKDFIANASHELRTPITIIQGFAETLQDHPDLTKELLEEIGGKILRTSVRLEKLIRSLLTLADIENVLPERFQMVDLISLSKQCQHQFLQSQPNVHLNFSTDTNALQVMADPLLLELAIVNLLENAAKYSLPPAQIRLKIYSDKGHAFLAVEDAGIGIPEEDLPYIFDRFYTVDKARSRKAGGAGLGLAIVKTIIEKHSGKIDVQSESAKGSTFTLSIPVK